jgi:MFS family permease
VVDVTKAYTRRLAIAYGARLGTDVAFYVFALFIITYVTEQLGLSRSTALNAVLIGSACRLALIPAFGALSDRVGRRPFYGVGPLGAPAWALAFFPLLDTEEWGYIVLAPIVSTALPAADDWSLAVGPRLQREEPVERRVRTS